MCEAAQFEHVTIVALTVVFTLDGKRFTSGSGPRQSRNSYIRMRNGPVPAGTLYSGSRVIHHSSGASMIRVGEVQVAYTARGLPRYTVEIWHDGLNKYQVLKSDDVNVLAQKGQAKADQWEEMWQKKKAAADKRALLSDSKAQAEDDTREAQQALSDLESILVHTLDIDDSIDWESLKNRRDYSVPKPEKKAVPAGPVLPSLRREPILSDLRYQPEISFVDKLISSRRLRKESEAAQRYTKDHNRWLEEKEAMMAAFATKREVHERLLSELDEEHKKEIAEWEKERSAYLAKRAESNSAIDAQKENYLAKEANAVREYCELVLSNSAYPDYFPLTFELDYIAETGILIVDYQLPPKESIPTLNEVRYIQSRDDFTEKHITGSQLNKLYDSILYQIALRTIHELYEADRADVLTSVVFNGYVDSVDPATGAESNSCILSVQAGRQDFLPINLARIDPKACFKSLKGIGSSKLHSLTPVAPIMSFDRDDKRFVNSYDVTATLDEGYNLASMDWEDFEHLVRELFEKEFTASGGEVRVTQASRDGGIDAVAFDPDPIRGGKIVIQAKRYTNTVGVSAVRDLYGTVLNEGANKGVLVTTADYGPDTYAFANGKPLVLISGSHLLHLLEKHGHRARIDLKEARALAIENRSGHKM